MKDLLIHTTKVKVDVLQPSKIMDHERPYICFSLNQFISHFGQYIYLFIKEDMEQKFRIKKVPSGGLEATAMFYRLGEPIEYKYGSRDLGDEYRIYEPVDIGRHCIGILTDFNYMEGRLETRLQEEVIKREMISFNKE